MEHDQEMDRNLSGHPGAGSPVSGSQENDRHEAAGAPAAAEPLKAASGTEKDLVPAIQAASGPSEAAPEPVFRFFVRTSSKNEFGITDFAQLQQLYHSGFLIPEAEVRRAGSDVWRRAGSMPELESVKPRPLLEGNEFALLSAGLCGATLLIMLILHLIRGS